MLGETSDDMLCNINFQGLKLEYPGKNKPMPRRSNVLAQQQH